MMKNNSIHRANMDGVLTQGSLYQKLTTKRVINIVLCLDHSRTECRVGAANTIMNWISNSTEQVKVGSVVKKVLSVHGR